MPVVAAREAARRGASQASSPRPTDRPTDRARPVNNTTQECRVRRAVASLHRPRTWSIEGGTADARDPSFLLACWSLGIIERSPASSFGNCPPTREPVDRRTNSFSRLKAAL